MKTVILSMFAVLMVSASAQAVGGTGSSCGNRMGGTLFSSKHASKASDSTPASKSASVPTANTKAVK